MSVDAILTQLKHIIDLLNRILETLDKIVRPKAGSVGWRLFFGYGEFAGQKSAAKEAAGTMLDVQTRLDDMVKTLQGLKPSLAKKIQELAYLDLEAMGNKLIEVPQRAQYMSDQIYEFGKGIKSLIKEVEQGKYD